MKTKKALKIIHTALMSYVEDSAGAESKEAKEIQKAYDKLVKKTTGETLTFGFRCSVTGEGFNGGYFIVGENRYIKYERDLVAWLRGRNVDEEMELSDEFLISEADEIGEYEYVSSITVDKDNCYDAKGNHCTTFKK
jgi:hypothetical protein